MHGFAISHGRPPFPRIEVERGAVAAALSLAHMAGIPYFFFLHFWVAEAEMD
jgi:hypothetical protein